MQLSYFHCNQRQNKPDMKRIHTFESFLNESVDISKLTDELLLQMISVMNTMMNVKSANDLKFMQELVKEKTKRKL